MNRSTPLKRTPFKRKNNSENTLAKVAQSHASKAQAAIIVVAKSRAVLPASVQAEAYRRLVASLRGVQAQSAEFARNQVPISADADLSGRTRSA